MSLRVNDCSCKYRVCDKLGKTSEKVMAHRHIRKVSRKFVNEFEGLTFD